MIIDKVRLNGFSTVDLPVASVDPSANYILKSIDGLGPPDIGVTIGRPLGQEGIYQASIPEGREIVVLVRLNPDYSVGQTVESLRTTLYSMIMFGLGSTDYANMQLYSGATYVAGTGPMYVSKFEIAPFGKDAEVQITFECVNTYLYAPNVTSLNTATLSKSTPTFTNPGSAPCGFVAQLTFTASLSSFKLWWNADSGQFILITYPFVSGDQLTIDTIDGAKQIYVIRSSILTNLLPYLSTDSIWLKARPGNNVFATSSSSFNWNAFTFQPRYWGI